MAGRISDEVMERRLHELRQTADEFADAQGERIYLDEFKKSKLAMLMKDAERAGHKTAAAQEREALANPEYIVLIEGLRDATKKAERMKWHLKIAELGVSVWQTGQANDRAERKAYGNT